MARKCKDFVGKRFNNLTALEPIPMVVNGHHRTYWKFQCDCGEIITIRLDGVINGSVKSCGCYQKITMSERMKGGNPTSFKKGCVSHNKGKKRSEWMDKEVSERLEKLNVSNLNKFSASNPQHLATVCESNKKPVVRMDLYGKVIEIHDSIDSAAKAVNRSHTGVGLVCNHYVNKKGYTSRTCGGHTFLFLDEYLNRKNNETI